jgi:cytochrome c
MADIEAGQKIFQRSCAQCHTVEKASGRLHANVGERGMRMRLTHRVWFLVVGFFG